MRDGDLRRVIEQLLAETRPEERETPASPEVVALSALLLGQVQNATVRRRVAGSASVDELMIWIAVDRLLLLLPEGARVPWGTRSVHTALDAAVDAVAETRRA